MTSSPASWAARTTAASADQPGAPSRSKQASCGLTATQAAPAASIARRQWLSTSAAPRGARPSGATTALAGPRRDRRRLRGTHHGAGGGDPQPLGVWVEAEADLAAALLDEGRQAVG